MDNSVRVFSGKNIKITKGDRGLLLNVVLSDGTEYKNVEPRRYFPISDVSRFISIVEPDVVEKEKKRDKELFVIRDAANLDPESKATLEDSLSFFYMIPRIIDILESKSQYGILQWTVMTDRGEYNFDIRDLYSSIKQLPDGRILVIDAHDNRYEITDYGKLSKKGQSLLLGYL